MSEIGIAVNDYVRISAFRYVDSGVCGDVGDEVEGGDDVEVEVEVGSRDGSSVSKYVKCGVNVMINVSVGWVVYIGVGAVVYRVVGVKANMSKVKSFWRLMSVYVEVF